MQAYLTIAFRISLLSVCILLLLPETAGHGRSGDAMQHMNRSAIVNEHLVDSLLHLSKTAANARTAIEYSDRALYLADSINSPVAKARALHQSGIAWKNFGDTEKSEERLRKAEEFFISGGLQTERHRVLRDLGETFRAGQSYDMSKSVLLQARDYFLMINDQEELAMTYNRLAATAIEVFWNRPDNLTPRVPPEGMDHEKFMTALNQRPNLLALYHELTGYLDTAMMLSLKLANHDLIFSNRNISIALLVLLYKSEEAIREYDVLIAEIAASGNLKELPLVLINKARMMGQFRINQPEKAIELAYEALALAQEMEINIYVYLAHEVLHDNYEVLGNYRKAYEHLAAIRDLQYQFQSEQMRLNAATHHLEYQIKLRELQLRSKREQIKLGIIAGVTLFLMLAMFILLVLRKNRKLRLLLHQVNNLNSTITKQNEVLSGLNSEKDRLFHIIAHDLRSPFNTISGFSEIIHREGATLTPENLREYTGLIHYTAERTLQLLESLLHWARIQVGSENYQPEQHQLNRLVETGITPLLTQAGKKGVVIRNQVPEDIHLICDEMMIVTVIRNLVSNGIKFSESGTEMFITAIPSGKEVLIRFQDYGIGISASSIAKLFRSDSGFSTPGTRDEPGTGFGLVLCKALVQKHHGTIRVESEEGKGSVFTVQLPLREEQ